MKILLSKSFKVQSYGHLINKTKCNEFFVVVAEEMH